MARPTTLPEWATDAAAVKTTPPIAKQVLGWLFQEKPPYDFFNWWQSLTFDWLEWLSEGGGSIPQYTAMADLVDEVALNDTALLRPHSLPPFDEVWTKSQADIGGGTQEVRAICGDGLRFFVAADRRLYGYDLSGASLWTPYDPVAGDVTTAGLVCDGDYVYWAFDGLIHVLDAATGVVNASTVTETGVAAIAVDGVDLYTAGTTGGNTFVKRWNDTQTGTPSVDWTNNTAILSTEAVNAISTNGDRVAVAHTNAGVGAQNMAVCEADTGTLIQAYEYDPTGAGNVDLEAVNYSSDYYYGKSAAGMFSDGVANQPHIGWSPLNNYIQTGRGGIQSFSTSTLGGTNMTLTEEYLAHHSAGGNNVFVYRNPKGGQTLAPIFSFAHVGMNAIFLDPSFLLFGGDEDTGVALSVRILPAKPRFLTRTGNGSARRYRAPFYGVVRQEAF